MDSRTVRVSVIIPHWNGIEVLAECLESLTRSTYTDLEIIVVDNASTDGSQAWLKTNYPAVRLIENESNFGYAGGCNRGAEAAAGDFLVFLNNDTIQDPSWLKPLVARLDSDSKIAAVQPKLRNYYRRDLFDYAGGAGGAMDVFGFPFARGRVFTHQETDDGQYDNPQRIFWASGTAFMIRRDIFLAAGRFDETFFAHMEEIDLCWRIHMLGYSVWAEPASIVYHKNAVSLPMQSVRKLYLNHRNSLLMLLSNYSLPLTLYLAPMRLFLEGVAFVYALVIGEFNHCIGILKALGWLVTHPHIILRKRRKVKTIKIQKDARIMEQLYAGSLVVAYYILRKKTYRVIA